MIIPSGLGYKTRNVFLITKSTEPVKLFRLDGWMEEGEAKVNYDKVINEVDTFIIN